MLEVADDGRGFDARAVRTELAGTAAWVDRSMRERARSVGGRLTCPPRRGAGTTVRLEMPTGA